MHDDYAYGYDCMGCLMEAHARGDLSDEDYDEALAQMDQGPLMGICPRCQQPAYVSEYEPDMMHCPACGLYSFREGGAGAWYPAMQGAAHTRS